MSFENWKSAQRPERIVLEGEFVRLEPLDPGKHTEALFESATAAEAEARFQYLFDHVPGSEDELRNWCAALAQSADPLFFAVVNKESGRAEGRQSFLRIDPAHGVIEIGNILWGPAIARTRVATEAFYLFAEYAFNLGYRRLEWKCNDLNEPSKRAALRFGFRYEGLFRQHMVVKGANRDTAWFAITDREWPDIRRGFRDWLRPENFTCEGHQLSKLSVT